jgi:uncharacterized protein involved in exopolysaccharide biosynthesis
MRLERFLEAVKRWWWLVLASVLLCTGASFFVPARMPAQYEATVRIYCSHSPYDPNPGSLNDNSHDPQQVCQRVQKIIRECATLEAAAESAGLPYVPSRGNISIRGLVPDSTFLEISVRDPDPERARALADAIVQQLVFHFSDEDDSDPLEEYLAFSEPFLKELEEDIRQTEDEIRNEQVRLDAANNAGAKAHLKNDIAALEQKLDSYKSTYARLASSVVLSLNMIMIEQPATTPTRPISSPPAAETVLLAAALGLLLGLVGACTMEFLVNLRTRRRASMAGGRGG